jgi:phosphate transport system substrate-binding protein
VKSSSDLAVKYLAHEKNLQILSRTVKRTVQLAALLSCAGLCTVAIAQDVLTAPKGAGYVLPDGTIRIVGAASLEGVVGKLDALFVQSHPGLRFAYQKADNNGAIDALIFDATPFAPLSTVYGGGIAYSDIVKATPFAIRVAHGSLNPKAKVSPLAVIVNASNPVEKLTIAEVASVFSKPVRARVFTKWAQVGLKGEQAEILIEPAGLPWSDHYASEDRAFGDDVFFRKFGSAAPVDNYRMFKTYAEVVDFVSREHGAIGIVQLNKLSPGVKVVGLVDGPFGVARKGSAEEIRSGHYPLDRYLYVQARVQNEKPLDLVVREYLLMVLSPKGQAAIAAEGEGYLPLNAAELAEEQGKLE